MKHSAKVIRTAATAAVVIATLAAGVSSAAGLRAPQVPVTPTALQDYFNSVGQTINAYTDQYDIQCWSTTVSNNATLTLMVELTAGLAPVNAFGIYNCSSGASPTTYQVFPGSAGAGWFAVASFFPSGQLVVNLFDAGASLISTSTYSGVDRHNFGFYLQNTGGTFYTEDSRNGGFAQALTYAGTGNSAGQWWICWEDLPYSQADLDFEDMVIFVESVNPPLPVESSTWGAIKNLY